MLLLYFAVAHRAEESPCDANLAACLGHLTLAVLDSVLHGEPECILKASAKYGPPYYDIVSTETPRDQLGGREGESAPRGSPHEGQSRR